MRTHIQVMKLFKKMKEGEYYDDTLIVYGSREWRTHFENDLTEVVDQYKHMIAINLWIIRLKFEWTSNTA